MDFLRFLLTRQFLKNFLLAIALTVIVIMSVLVFLRIYTHHGQAISVPDLSGLTLSEVDDVLASRRLRYEITDSIFSLDVPRGTVVKQNPDPNSKVKVNRKIFLTMNAVNPERVAMPQLTGLSLRKARIDLENHGLILGQISYQPDYAVNSVLQQKYKGSVITEGTMINKGSVIDLVLGMGLSNETTVVPELVGLDLRTARARITDRYLNLGAVTYDSSVLTEVDSLTAFIWRQYPEVRGRERLNLGMEVDVWLTLDSTLLPVPDSVLYDPGVFDDENE